MSSGKFTEYPYVCEIHFGLRADRPVQLNYEYCKGCGKQGLGCIQPHRFFTFEGWLAIWLALLETPPYTKHQVMSVAYQAGRFFPGGFDGGEIGRCIVCRRTDCSRPHRKYTREGYAKYQIELMGIPREEAMKRANEEFRGYGGDWAFYPHRGEFGPPKEYDQPAQVRAPPPPPEGWPQVNDDRYVKIIKTIRQAWKTESEGKSEAELLKLRDEFHQRWANMSGEVPPRFHMSWDDLPRPPPDTGGVSRGQYAGTDGGFVPLQAGQGPIPGANYGGGMPGFTGGQPQPGAQSGNSFDAYKNIPGMPNIFFSGSGRGKGFTFHHHAGGQSQSYEFPSDRERRRRRRRRSYDEDEEPPQQQQTPPRKPEYTGPSSGPKEAGSKDTKSGSSRKEPKKEQTKEGFVDNPFNDSIKWYAKTFLEKTKGESVAATRILAETLCKEFVKEWGAWASTVEMPWDQDPRLKGKNGEAHGGDGARSPKDRSSRSRGNMDGYNTSGKGDGGLSVGDSFEQRATNRTRSQRRGSRDGYKPSRTSDEEAFEERCDQSRKSERRTTDEDAFEDRYKNSTRSERYRKDDRPYKPSGKDRDAFEDRFKAWQKFGADNPNADAFDERYQKWKKSGAPPNPDMDAFDERYGKWSSKRAHEKRRDYSDESDNYDSDASIGPPYPKAPRGAGNQEYEDTRREYEERWAMKSRDRRESELQDLRVAMGYAWLQQLGRNGRGEMMPWHSHYRKHVRRPSGSRSAAGRKNANNSYNHSRMDTSSPKPYQDNSSNSRPDPGVRERDRTDTSYPKSSQEHSRTDPNERQSHPYGGQPSQPKDTSATGTNEDKTTERPYVFRSKAERQSDKLAKADQKYEEHKTKCSIGCDAARSKTSGSPEELRKLAQMHQVKFKRTTDDERAKTEVMPWARYIGSHKPSTTASTKPGSPKRNRGGESKNTTGPPKPTSKPTTKPTNTTKPTKLNLPLFGMDRMYEKHKADLTEKWQRILKNATSEAALKKLAQVHHVKFEATIDDPRAKTEIMPWTKHIRGDDNGAREPPKSPKPTPPKDDASKPKPDSKEFSKDCERMRAAKMMTSSNIPLKRLAQQHQVKFENAIHDPRTKTDTLPWTKYIHRDPDVKTDPLSIPPSKPRSLGAPKSSTTPKPTGASSGDTSYDKHKTDFIKEWEEFCKTISSPVALREQAQIQQVKFEDTTKDERAKYEVMPWSKYTGVKSNTPPPKPDAYTASTSKPAAPSSSNTRPAKLKGDDIVDKLISQKPVLSSDEANLLKYERCITRFNAKWDSLCENSPGVSRRELARKFQKNFEKTAADDRAKTEEMPWSHLLEGREKPSAPVAASATSHIPPIIKAANVLTTKDIQPDVSAGADEKYSELKADCIQKWEEESKPITSPAALRSLAQVHQVKFEHWDEGDRSKTEEMPWSKYLRLGTTAKKDTSQPRKNDTPKPKLPLPDVPVKQEPKQQSSAPALTQDQAYTKHKAVFAEEWAGLSARTKSQAALQKLAKDLQLRFKHQTENERAKTEVMPWWMYLKTGNSPKQKVDEVRKADPSPPHPSDQPAQKHDIPTPSEKPGLPKLDTKRDFEKPKKPSGYHSFKNDPSKQLTVETEPPSPERYSSTDVTSEPAAPVIQPSIPKASASPLVPPTLMAPAEEPSRRPSAVSGIRYEMLKGRFEMGWDVKKGKHVGGDYSAPAKAMQTAFEEASTNTRSKTEVMPWTKYLKVAPVSTAPAVDDSVNVAQRRRHAQKPAAKPAWKSSMMGNRPEPRALPPAKRPSQPPTRRGVQKSAYDRAKAKFEMEWLLLQENEEGYELWRPARNIQKAFEQETADERAKTEVLPWTRYLKVEEDAPPAIPGSPEYDSASIYSSESSFMASPERSPAVPVSSYENIEARFETTWDLKKEGYEEDEYAELAVGMQKSFEMVAGDERAQTELMSWTMYLPVGFGAAPKDPKPPNSKRIKSTDDIPLRDTISSFTALSFEQPRERKQSLKPDENHVEAPKPSNRVADINYERHKELYEPKWDTLLETRKGESRVRLAKKIQKGFETKIADDRAKTEKMPLTKYLGMNGVVERTEFVPPEPEPEPFPFPNKPPAASHPVRHDEPPPRSPPVQQFSWSEPPIPKQPPSQQRPLPPERATPPSMPLSYDEEVVYATRRWGRRKKKYPGEDIAVLAQKMQRGFEGAAKDERAKEQMMPWTRFHSDWHLHVQASAAYDMRPKKQLPRNPPASEPTRNTTQRVPQQPPKTSPAQSRHIHSSPALPAAPVVPSKPKQAPKQSLAEYKVQYEAWYENCRRNIVAKWDDELLKHDGDDNTSLARQFQAAFEGTGDSRAKSAAMPWTVYLSAQPMPIADKEPIGLGLYTAGSVKTIGGDRPVPVLANDPEARYEGRKAKRIDYWWHKYDKHRGEDHTQRAIFFQGKFEDETDYKWARAQPMPWDKYLPKSGKHSKPKARGKYGSANEVPRTLPKEEHTFKVLESKEVAYGVGDEDETYEQRKLQYIKNWNVISDANKEDDRPAAAREIQRKFVEQTEDDRFQDEVMPWQTSLRKHADEPKVSKPKRQAKTKKGPNKVKIAKWKLPKEDKHRSSKHAKDKPKAAPKDISKTTKRMDNSDIELEPDVERRPEAGPAGVEVIEDDEEEEPDEEGKARYTALGPYECEGKKGVELADFAAKMQRDWVRRAQHEHPINEVMPWQQYMTKHVVAELKYLKPKFMTMQDRGKHKQLSKKKPAEPLTNVHHPVRDAVLKLNYDFYAKNWNEMYADKPRDWQISAATEFRKVWLEKVGTRTHEVRMPWDDVLDVREDRDEDANFDLLSVRLGRDRFDIIRDGAGEDQEGVDWEQLFKDKKAAERAERKRKEEKESRRKQQKGCGQQ